jgi:hypothetical protein
VPPGRQTMREAYLKPGYYAREELEEMGLFVRLSHRESVLIADRAICGTSTSAAHVNTSSTMKTSAIA